MSIKENDTLQKMDPPTWQRYKRLFLQKGSVSILRNLQYELLQEIRLEGKVLDFGGGKKADYLRFLSCEHYQSVNIDSNMEPTWVSKIGAALPCPSHHYDTTISMNTIEHIYDARFALQEMHKALKTNGTFICALPFLYPIHAHPDDYFRPTASWWEITLTEIGFYNIKITPLLWGPFTTGLTCSGIPGPFKTFRLHCSLLADLTYHYFKQLLSKPYDENIANFALGYMIEAQKS